MRQFVILTSRHENDGDVMVAIDEIESIVEVKWQDGMRMKFTDYRSITLTSGRTIEVKEHVVNILAVIKEVTS